MRKLMIAILAVALMLSAGSGETLAQVNVQFGASMLKPAEGQVGVAPALSVSPDFDAPLDFGFTFTAPEDTTYEAVLYIEYGARKWEFSSGKSFELKFYVGTDVKQGSQLQHKRFAFTGEYDAGKIDGVNTYGRLVHNRVSEGVNWGIEFGVALELDGVLGGK